MIGQLATIARSCSSSLLAIALCALIFELAGYSAVDLLGSIAEGAFFRPAPGRTGLRWGLPLFITARGVVIAFRCGYFNIGAQGQFYMGAIADVRRRLA